jgi:hypothetical protein
MNVETDRLMDRMIADYESIRPGAAGAP